MALWLFNILFDFCFRVFLTEACFNCLLYTPRAWVGKGGLLNEMIIALLPFFLFCLNQIIIDSIHT